MSIDCGKRGPAPGSPDPAEASPCPSPCEPTNWHVVGADLTAELPTADGSLRPPGLCGDRPVRARRRRRACATAAVLRQRASRRRPARRRSPPWSTSGRATPSPNSSAHAPATPWSFTRNTTDALNLLARACPPGTTTIVFDSEHHANLLPWPSPLRLPAPAGPDEAVLAVHRALAVDQRPGAARGHRREQRDRRDLAGAAAGRRSRTPTARGSSWMPRNSRRTCRSTWTNSAPTISPCPATSCTRRSAPACWSAARDWLDAAEPYLRGGGASAAVGADPADVTWATGPARHEGGTPNLIGAVALAAVCAALLRADRQALYDHEQSLLARARWRHALRRPGAPGRHRLLRRSRPGRHGRAARPRPRHRRAGGAVLRPPADPAADRPRRGRLRVGRAAPGQLRPGHHRDRHRPAHPRAGPPRPPLRTTDTVGRAGPATIVRREHPRARTHPQDPVPGADPAGPRPRRRARAASPARSGAGPPTGEPNWLTTTLDTIGGSFVTLLRDARAAAGLPRDRRAHRQPAAGHQRRPARRADAAVVRDHRADRRGASASSSAWCSSPATTPTVTADGRGRLDGTPARGSTSSTA